MWMLLAAEIGASAKGQTTPLCKDVIAALDAGAARREVVRTLDAATVTREDVACLHGADLPRYAVRRAQRQLVRASGLDALPTGPVDVWALVPDPCAVAGAQAPVIGLFGQAMCSLDLTGTLPGKVADYIESRAREALVERDLEGDVELRSVKLPAVEGISWEGSSEEHELVTAGRHYVLYVHLPDAVAAARALDGDLRIGFRARRGLDIAAAARETIRREVWSQLAQNDIPSMLVDLEGIRR